MRKQTFLTATVLALLLSPLPLSSLLAEPPSNAELYQMLLKLQKELSATKEENRALRQLIKPSKGAVTRADKSVQPQEDRPARPVPAATIAKIPVAKPYDDYDETQAVQEKPVSISAKIKKSYLSFASADGNIKYWIDGRIMLDGGFANSGGNSLTTNTEFRRARLAIKTKMYKNWSGEFDIDFSEVFGPHDHSLKIRNGDNTDVVVAIDDSGAATTAEVETDEDGATGGIKVSDMWIAYHGFPRTTIKLGNHKPPFSMAEVTTSRWYAFMETPMVTDTFAPGRRIGLSATNWGKYHMVGAAVFGDEWLLNPVDNDREERFGWAARGVYRPIVADNANKIVHLGFNYLAHKPQSDAWDKENERVEFKYSARPEAHFIDYKFMNTGNMRKVDKISTWGLELAGKWDRFYAQSEYLQSRVGRIDDQDPTFSGWYVMASYFLTNDSRSYNLDDGEFGAVMPSTPLGAFELALRYSTLDLNDNDASASRPVTGGEAHNTTLGLNWYVNNNIIFRANYIHANHDEYATVNGVDDNDLDIFGMRAEYLF